MSFSIINSNYYQIIAAIDDRLSWAARLASWAVSGVIITLLIMGAFKLAHWYNTKPYHIKEYSYEQLAYDIVHVGYCTVDYKHPKCTLPYPSKVINGVVLELEGQEYYIQDGKVSMGSKASDETITLSQMIALVKDVQN